MVRGIGIPRRELKLRLNNREKYTTQGMDPRAAAVKSCKLRAGPAGMVRAASSKRVRKLAAEAKTKRMTKQTLKKSTNRANSFIF
jgi:hypothetical protein